MLTREVTMNLQIKNKAQGIQLLWKNGSPIFRKRSGIQDASALVAAAAAECEDEELSERVDYLH